jgi:hypothetical protein
MTTQILKISNVFWDAYGKVLKELSLFERAQVDTPAGIHGGKSIEDAHAHFVGRCSNSCSRLTYILESGDNKFKNIYTSIITTLSSDKVTIIDIGAGNGGGMHGMLSSLIFLRKHGHVPCLPLAINIIGADFSIESLNIYKKMILELSEDLKNTGVLVEFIPFYWDASNIEQTAKLCDFVKEKYKANEYFIFISALSGIRKHKLDEWHRQFQHVFDSFSARNCSSMWIEPGEGSGMDFLKKVIKKIYSLCTWFKPCLDEDLLYCEYKWHHKFQNKNLTGTLSVKKYDKANLV